MLFLFFLIPLVSAGIGFIVSICRSTLAIDNQSKDANIKKALYDAGRATVVVGLLSCSAKIVYDAYGKKYVNGRVVKQESRRSFILDLICAFLALVAGVASMIYDPMDVFKMLQGWLGKATTIDRLYGHIGNVARFFGAPTDYARVNDAELHILHGQALEHQQSGLIAQIVLEARRRLENCDPSDFKRRSLDLCRILRKEEIDRISAIRASGKKSQTFVSGGIEFADKGVKEDDSAPADDTDVSRAAETKTAGDREAVERDYQQSVTSLLNRKKALPTIEEIPEDDSTSTDDDLLARISNESAKNITLYDDAKRPFTVLWSKKHSSVRIPATFAKRALQMNHAVYQQHYAEQLATTNVQTFMKHLVFVVGSDMEAQQVFKLWKETAATFPQSVVVLMAHPTDAYKHKVLRFDVNTYYKNMFNTLFADARMNFISRCPPNWVEDCSIRFNFATSQIYAYMLNRLEKAASTGKYYHEGKFYKNMLMPDLFEYPRDLIRTFDNGYSCPTTMRLIADVCGMYAVKTMSIPPPDLVNTNVMTHFHTVEAPKWVRNCVCESILYNRITPDQDLNAFIRLSLELGELLRFGEAADMWNLKTVFPNDFLRIHKQGGVISRPALPDQEKDDLNRLADGPLLENEPPAAADAIEVINTVPEEKKETKFSRFRGRLSYSLSNATLVGLATFVIVAFAVVWYFASRHQKKQNSIMKIQSIEETNKRKLDDTIIALGKKVDDLKKKKTDLKKSKKEVKQKARVAIEASKKSKWNHSGEVDPDLELMNKNRHLIPADGMTWADAYDQAEEAGEYDEPDEYMDDQDAPRQGRRATRRLNKRHHQESKKEIPENAVAAPIAKLSDNNAVAQESLYKPVATEIVKETPHLTVRQISRYNQKKEQGLLAGLDMKQFTSIPDPAAFDSAYRALCAYVGTRKQAPKDVVKVETPKKAPAKPLPPPPAKKEKLPEKKAETVVTSTDKKTESVPAKALPAKEKTAETSVKREAATPNREINLPAIIDYIGYVCNSDDQAYGMGTAIGNYFITAAHVPADASTGNSIHIRFRNKNTTTRATMPILYNDSTAGIDYCICKKPDGMKSLPTSRMKNPVQGGKIFLVNQRGAPVPGKVGSQALGSLHHHDADTSEGDSGTAIWTYDGAFVGFHIGGDKLVKGANFFQPQNILQRYLIQMPGENAPETFFR